MDELYEVFALKYAERNGRTRSESFILDDDHAAPHPMDYFVWVIRNGNRTILVDTGYEAEEASHRGRPIQADPVRCLADFGIAAESIETVIVTHLHYDHAGMLNAFPNAVFHLQAAEMAFATGPCMCHEALRMPFTGTHICDMVRHVYSGRVVFHDGDGTVAPGVDVVAIGGHSRGLQAVRIKTERGWMMLASDASHFYENMWARKPFPIVADLEPMLSGFDRLDTLASSPELIIPGHDPIVCAAFPMVAGKLGGPSAHRLDVAPGKTLETEMKRFGKVG